MSHILLGRVKTLCAFIGLLFVTIQATPGFEGQPSPSAYEEEFASWVSITSQTSNSVSFAMQHSSGVTGWAVYYIRAEDNYTSSTTSTSAGSISYTNLPAGNYTFYFDPIGPGPKPLPIITDDLLMG